jgi:hypothetical protein
LTAPEDHCYADLANPQAHPGSPGSIALMQLPPRRRIGLSLCASALALLAGCKDAPTGPDALRLAAGGREWLAISAPTDLPTSGTWTPFLMRQGEGGKELVGVVRSMEKAAEREQLDGHFARATSLRREAASLAVSSLRTPPSADVLLESAGAVDRWIGRVEEVGLEKVLVGATVDSVRARRTAAASALEAGDTLGAVRELMAASERIRRWSPFEIAARALARAESGVAAMEEKGPARNRARHLAMSARQELRRGDPLRALERALYAIQISGGAEMDAALADPPARCEKDGC